MGEKARRFCSDVVLAALAAAVGIFLVKKLFFLLVPVGAGYLFSEAVRGSFRKLKPVSKPVKRVLIILVLMILFAFLFLVLTLAAEKALTGVRALGDQLTGTAARLTDVLRDLEKKAAAWLSGVFHRDMDRAVTEFLPDLLSEGARRLAQRLPDLVGAIAGGMPTLIISLILFLFCGYFFSCEWETVRALFDRLCPAEHQGAVRRKKSAFLRTFKKIIGAYGLLFLLTFSELFLGFLVLGVTGAAGKALTVALVDALPVFGCGTVLVPWGVILLLRGEAFRGAGLLVLYLCMAAVRQFAEPKIVGRSIGLHPVVSLILMLSGLKLFGVAGMILLPLFAACLRDGEKAAGT